VKISAHVDNRKGNHHVTLKTDDSIHSLNIPPTATGFGSSVNGGELLFLALATCYCNDIYREATKTGMTVERVEVEVEGEFGAEGEAARNITYQAKVAAAGSEEEILELMEQTDRVAEIQNTLRAQTPVRLDHVEVMKS
jgi:organic hydroperoxide reductase OsmC/OhrA